MRRCRGSSARRPSRSGSTSRQRAATSRRSFDRHQSHVPRGYGCRPRTRGRVARHSGAQGASSWPAAGGRCGCVWTRRPRATPEGAAPNRTGEGRPQAGQRSSDDSDGVCGHRPSSPITRVAGSCKRWAGGRSPTGLPAQFLRPAAACCHFCAEPNEHPAVRAGTKYFTCSSPGCYAHAGGSSFHGHQDGHRVSS